MKRIKPDSKIIQILCDPMNTNPQAPLSMEFSRQEDWSHSLLQGIFPTQGSNPGLPHCRWILYCLSHQGSPRKLLGSLSLLQGIFLTQGSNWGLLHCRLFLKFRQCHGETFFRCYHTLKASIFYSQGFLPLSLALHKVKFVYPLELINIHKTSLFVVLFYE